MDGKTLCKAPIVLSGIALCISGSPILECTKLCHPLHLKGNSVEVRWGDGEYVYNRIEFLANESAWSLRQHLALVDLFGIGVFIFKVRLFYGSIQYILSLFI